MKTQSTAKEELGTVTLSQKHQFLSDGTTFEVGEVFKVTKVVESPTGIRYYKLSGTIHWLSDKQVCNVNINNISKPRTVKIYSA